MTVAVTPADGNGQTARTRAAFFEVAAALAAGDADRLARRLHGEVTVVWPTSSPMAGWAGRDEVARALCDGSAPREIGLDPSTFTTRPGRLAVDGRIAMVEVTVEATTSTGGRYVNDFVFVYEFDDEGLLLELREYGDTISAARQAPHAWAGPVAALVAVMNEAEP